MSSPGPLRVGAVSYLNAIPLTVALRDHPGVSLVEDVPSAVADGLAGGALDAGLVPLAEVIRHPEWGRVPGPGIVSRGPVETVLVVSRVPFGEIVRIGMDVSSRTSVVLARIVLAEVHGASPETVPARPAEAEPDEPAWLVIGDPAFGANGRADLRVLDLGEAWTARTGLPMVYAVWALREGLDPASVAPVFLEARARGLASLDRWLAPEAARRGIGASRARRYLTRVIRYEVGEAEERAITEFARRGAAWL